MVNAMKKIKTKISTAMLMPRQIDTKQPPFRSYSMSPSSIGEPEAVNAYSDASP